MRSCDGSGGAEDTPGENGNRGAADTPVENGIDGEDNNRGDTAGGANHSNDSNLSGTCGGDNNSAADNNCTRFTVPGVIMVKSKLALHTSSYVKY